MTIKIESYFSGNIVCGVDKELDCEPLCSNIVGVEMHFGQ